MHALLDKYLCDKYPKIFAERNLPMSETCMCWGFDVGNGWFSLINSLCHNIQTHIDSHNEGVDNGYDWVVKIGKIPQVVAKQVKEKFSGLRFYYTGGDEKIRGMVDFAEDLSYSICEECSIMNEEVGRNPKGWIVTTCKKHARLQDNFQTNGEEDLTELWKKVRQDEEKEQQKKLNKAYSAEK